MNVNSLLHRVKVKGLYTVSSSLWSRVHDTLRVPRESLQLLRESLDVTSGTIRPSNRRRRSHKNILKTGPSLVWNGPFHSLSQTIFFYGYRRKVMTVDNHLSLCCKFVSE